MLSSASYIEYSDSLLEYSTGEFQALQLIFRAVIGAVG